MSDDDSDSSDDSSSNGDYGSDPEDNPFDVPPCTPVPSGRSDDSSSGDGG